MAKLVSVQITERLIAIAEGITIGNGYASNVGARVFAAKMRGMADIAPAVFVIPGKQKDEHFYDTREIVREVEIKAFADVRVHPSLTEYELVDQIIADLRKAFAANDSGLAALGEFTINSDQPGYSEDGGNIVGAAISATITYRIAESDPTTAL